MQLRHIRPGSLEWQESKAEELDQGYERLTPEEIQHLRSVSENEEATIKEAKKPPLDVQ
jgi:hypothetical protein